MATKNKAKEDKLEFDMKHARYEVIKFATQGFYQRKKEKLLETSAIKLGAKPDRKKYHNYKTLQQIRGKQKMMRENHMKQLYESKNFTNLNKYRQRIKKAKKKNQKQHKSNDILKVWGTIKQSSK